MSRSSIAAKEIAVLNFGFGNKHNFSKEISSMSQTIGVSLRDSTCGRILHYWKEFTFGNQ